MIQLWCSFRCEPKYLINEWKFNYLQLSTQGILLKQQ